MVSRRPAPRCYIHPVHLAARTLLVVSVLWGAFPSTGLLYACEMDGRVHPTCCCASSESTSAAAGMKSGCCTLLERPSSMESSGIKSGVSLAFDSSAAVLLADTRTSLHPITSQLRSCRKGPARALADRPLFLHDCSLLI